MKITALQVKEKAISSGVDLCGIASSDRFTDLPAQSNPAHILPECKSVIVIAVKFLRGTLHSASPIPYTIVRNQLSRAVDRVTMELAYFLEESGSLALPTGAIEPCNYNEQLGKSVGLISLKNAAVQAGLGTIGKNTLLITPAYGNLVWLGAVITSAPLDADPLLTEKFSSLTDYQNIPVAAKIFPDGESYVRLEGSVQGEEVAIVQTTCPPAQDGRLFQLAFMADAAKRGGASKVTAVVPYLAYARQDKMFLAGEGISVETIARMLKASGIDELVTVNIHSESALTQFPFPAKTLSAIPLLAQHFVDKGFKGAFALSPDKGAMYIAKQAQAVLGGEVGHLDKVRDRYTGQTKQTAEGLNVKAQTVIILDDIISTGGTIVGAAKILREQGAKHVFCACVHGLLIGDAEKRILDAGVEEIVGTDSVPGNVSKVSLAPLISQELKAQK